LPADRSKILAWKIEKALVCPDCGTRRDEWEHDHNAYVVESSRCIGCEKVQWEQHSWAEEPSSAYGVKFRLVKPDSLSPIRMPSTNI